jgi:hypothetical protein
VITLQGTIVGEQRCLSHVYTQNPSLSQWALLNVGFIGLDGFGNFTLAVGVA